MLGTNTLAYLSLVKATKKKSFIWWTTGHVRKFSLSFKASLFQPFMFFLLLCPPNGLLYKRNVYLDAISFVASAVTQIRIRFDDIAENIWEAPAILDMH